MSKCLATLAVTFALAGCGADGAPDEPPENHLPSPAQIEAFQECLADEGLNPAIPEDSEEYREAAKACEVFSG